MAIVKMRIIATQKDNEALIQLLSKLFEIPANFIEGPHPNRDLTSSYLTFNFDKINLKEVLSHNDQI